MTISGRRVVTLASVTTYVSNSASNTVNITKQTDRNGRVTEYEYDAQNQLVLERWKDGSSTVRQITFTYDIDGQLLSSVDSTGPTTTYTYDHRGRVTSETTQTSSDSPLLRVASQYDVSDRRRSATVSTDGVGDHVNRYEYDELGRVTSLTQGPASGSVWAAPKRADYAYDSVGRLSAVTRYADLAKRLLTATSTYTYDAASRLMDLSHTNAAGGSAGYSQLLYDTLGRVIRLDNDREGTYTYTFDGAGRLTRQWRSWETTEDFSYDAQGNRVSTTTYDPSANGTTVAVTTGDDDRLTNDGTYTYLYDGEGNITKRTKTADGIYDHYTWDHRNRLMSVESYTSSEVLTQQATFTYDASDRRIAKRVDADTDSVFETTEHYGYDGSDIALVVNTTGGVVSRLFHGPGVDEPLAEEVPTIAPTDPRTGTHWYLTDHAGSVRDIIDSAVEEGTVGQGWRTHMRYSAFGLPVEEVGDGTPFRYGFAGREWDAEIGLYYNRARYYDPQQGRFLSTDPSGFGGSPLGNLYQYADGDPVNLSDPTGLAAGTHGGGAATGRPQTNSGINASNWWKPSIDWSTSGGTLAQNEFGGSYSQNSPFVTRSFDSSAPSEMRIDTYSSWERDHPYLTAYVDFIDDLTARGTQWGRDWSGGAHWMKRDPGGDVERDDRSKRSTDGTEDRHRSPERP